MKTLVVVPMKAPCASKTRLHARLGAENRARIARHLFERTIKTLSGLRAEADFDLAVVTASDAIGRIAQSAGARWISDPDDGLNAALETASRVAREAEYTRLCVFPADLAAPRRDDLLRVITLDAPRDTVVICPATDSGTNALSMRPGAMGFCFGIGSARRHAEAARQAGLSALVLPIESLSRDIDTARDLAHATERDTTLAAMS